MSNFNKKWIVIGERIYKTRKALKITQKDVAAFAGCTRQYIGDIENGASVPTMDVLLSMCELFECELGYLLCEQETPKRETADAADVTGLDVSTVNAISYKAHGENETGEQIETEIRPRAEMLNYLFSRGFADILDEMYILPFECVRIQDQAIESAHEERENIAAELEKARAAGYQGFTFADLEELENRRARIETRYRDAHYIIGAITDEICDSFKSILKEYSKQYDILHKKNK